MITHKTPKAVQAHLNRDLPYDILAHKNHVKPAIDGPSTYHKNHSAQNMMHMVHELAPSPPDSDLAGHQETLWLLNRVASPKLPFWARYIKTSRRFPVRSR